MERTPIGAHRRIGQQQAARIRVRGVGQDGSRRPAFDGAPRIHDNHVVANLYRQPQVVGDENDGGAVLALHVRDQPDDRRVHGDIERRRRLIGNDQAWIAGKRHRNEHALAHAAGQLMRISPKQFARLRQLRGVQHGERAPATIVAASTVETRKVFVELCADRQYRIKRGQRRLRDERDRSPQKSAPPRPGHLQKVLALECQFACRDRKTGRQ
ncbi:MAG: hypothetical protein WBC94_19050 [Xanthobacteraceae bacterium]